MKILMLAHQSEAISNMILHLQAENVQVTLHQQIKSFLVDVTRLKPTHALISANFHVPNLKQIRQLLHHVYRVILVDFIEEQNLMARIKIRDLDSDFKIYGIPQRKTIERMIENSSMRRKENDSAVIASSDLTRGMRAVLKTILFNQPEVHTELMVTKKVYCLEMASGNTQCKFIIALAGDHQIDEECLTDLSSGLVKLMQGLGFVVEGIERHHLEIERVEFRNWAQSSGHAFETASYEGKELGLVFLPAITIKSDLYQENSTGMLKLELSELRPEVSLGFDVYLHLPLNDKFILYLPKEGRMNRHIQEALSFRGVSAVFAKKQEARSLKRLRAINEINQSITTYYQNQCELVAA